MLFYQISWIFVINPSVTCIILLGGEKTFLQQASALPHIIVLTEAKPKNVILKWNPIWFKLDCYKLTDKSMDPEDKRRRMLLYIRGDIETKEVTHEFGFDEIQAYELFLQKENIIFVSIYSSPSSPYENNVKLNKILRAIGGNRKKHIVCGDTNFRDIDWDNCTTNHDENSKEHQGNQGLIPETTYRQANVGKRQPRTILIRSFTHR